MCLQSLSKECSCLNQCWLSVNWFGFTSWWNRLLHSLPTHRKKLYKYSYLQYSNFCFPAIWGGRWCTRDTSDLFIKKSFTFASFQGTLSYSDFHSIYIRASLSLPSMKTEIKINTFPYSGTPSPLFCCGWNQAQGYQKSFRNKSQVLMNNLLSILRISSQSHFWTKTSIQMWPTAARYRFSVKSLKLLSPFSIPLCFPDKPQINSRITSALLARRFTASGISILSLDTLEEKPNFNFHVCRRECWTPSYKCHKALLLRKLMKYYKALGLTIWKFDPKMPLFEMTQHATHITPNNTSFTLRPVFFLSQFRSFMIRKKRRRKKEY